MVRRLDVGPGQPARPRRRACVEDVEEFRTYLRAALGADYDAARVDAFLAAAPEMVRFFHEHTALTFVPGAADLRRLRRPARRRHRPPLRRARPRRRPRRSAPTCSALLRRQLYETSFLGMGVMAGPDLAAFLSASRGNPRGLLHATRRVARHVYDLVTRRRGMQLVNGTALVGRLLRSALDLGVDVRVSLPGHRAAPRRGRPGHRRRRRRDRRTAPLAGQPRPRRRARRRAVPARRRPPPALFPRTPTGAEHWSLAPATADGAGTTLGESAGGRLRTDVASPAAWCPVSLVPYRSGRVGRACSRTSWTGAKPGSIGVLSTGRRFVNEANGYHDYVTAMIAAAPEGEPVQAWQIADARFVRRYPLGMAKPRPVPLFPYLRSGYLKKGRTLAELARACGIDPRGWPTPSRSSTATPAAVWTRSSAAASTPFNRYGGDPTRRPEPVARAAGEGPVLRRADRARQLRHVRRARHRRPRPRPRRRATRPIPGLYAVGNDQASVMGGHYPAGGINIGPAMAFGYVAGRDLAAVSTRTP